jgi:hypothetical protein
MLYYHVDRHSHAYHLLQSPAYDVMGLTYHRIPRLVIGNYWWSKVSYLSALLSLQYEDADKYSAEAWLLSYTRRQTRYFINHFSLKDQALVCYPRYCYTSTLSKVLPLPETLPVREDDDELQNDEGSSKAGLYETAHGPFPTYRQWQEICSNMSLTYYQHIHHMLSSSKIEVPLEAIVGLDEVVDSKQVEREFYCVGQIFGSKAKE